MAEMKKYRFASALVGDVWQDDVCVGVDEFGLMHSITPATDANSDNVIDTGLVALPGMINVHSHAFQRAFAGLSEYRTSAHDSFWTWRKLMYHFLLQLTPDDVYVIARQLYLEMLAAGYTWVTEFHYLHNDVDGTRYANVGEMSDAIIRAAEDVGIGLCLLPVLYQRGGFDNSSLAGGQKRFELSDDQFSQLVEQCRNHSGANYVSGVSLHSLRAVGSETGKRIVNQLGQLPDGTVCPIHIHVAEQMKEVNDCISAHEKRPVEFLFHRYEVASNWCLIHATHLTNDEVRLIAGSSAVVGLCPTTEANLGDGYFSAEEFLDLDGKLAIGSDSNISIDVRDELRTLEYNQRLRFQRRAVLGTDSVSVGRRLYDVCQRGGAQAIGLGGQTLSVGSRADMTLVDPNHPAVAGSRNDRLIDSCVFSNCGNPVRGTIVGGTLHDVSSESFANQYRESSQQFVNLRSRLTDTNS